MSEALVVANGVGKRFGAVLALDKINFTINTGQCLGLVGHNGAGKSTLMNILAGTLSDFDGQLEFPGFGGIHHYDVVAAQHLGIRCVFQELSMCPNLTVTENTGIFHPSARGFSWRAAMRSLITSKLDEIFPGHRINESALVSDLTIAQRQMVEIARAFTVSNLAPRLVILDEPTSSLDATIANQLVQHVRRYVRAGGACIMISHILDEVLQISDVIAVMRDGSIVDQRIAEDFTKASLVETMGSVAKEDETHTDSFVSRRSDADPIISYRPIAQSNRSLLCAHKNEIVGLAGLGGQGQTQTLMRIFESRSSSRIDMAFVAGDRQNDGIFPLWSIGRNIGIGSLKSFFGQSLINRFLLNGEREFSFAEAWRSKMAIRTEDTDNDILSLSGGNQQKVLFARALGSSADVILMDDPMRGVDISTKREVYGMIREEAERGRTFVWYTTEWDELVHCDHVYVFRNGQITADMSKAELTEQKVLQASFEDAA